MFKTEKAVKDQFVGAGHEAADHLYRILGKDNPITILDIGACDGLSTIRYARMFPNARFWVFEMRQDNASEAEDNFDLYGIRDRTTVICRALGNYNGNAPMWVSSGQAPKVKTWNTGNKSSSLLRPTEHTKVHPWCKFEEETVGIIRLDEIKNIPPIDFVHIDVQGAEIKVFQGFGARLQEPKAIWAEMVKKPLYAGQPTKDMLIQYMRHNGFELLLDCCEGDSGDGLFVRGQ